VGGWFDWRGGQTTSMARRRSARCHCDGCRRRASFSFASYFDRCGIRGRAASTGNIDVVD
jgi:hypothetical protein